MSKDSFTDLKILCKDDWFGGVSMHKAVLASISPFMASILSDGRDETTLLMPDVDKHDMLNLVKLLYGGKHDNQTPSDELLRMLGIKELPKVIPKASTTNITSEFPRDFLHFLMTNRLYSSPPSLLFLDFPLSRCF